MTDDSSHPTILVAYETKEFRDVLIRELQQKGYLVFVAQNMVEASEIVVRHSRRIHLLLAEDGDNDRLTAETLKPYRPSMSVIHVSSNLEISAILMKVATVLDPPPKRQKRGK